ncbi:hypothetical protein BASA81_017686 [Batrachochytrium salamandrivorans]|nr:hypothetical protein BASA81_017686 [Batrachochytrium salamandrivorans]
MVPWPRPSPGTSILLLVSIMQLDGSWPSQFKDMTESAVAAFLYELMMTYGAPFEIISDRGKSFLAEGIDLFEARKQDPTLSNDSLPSQTNGMVERMHAMLGHGLTTLVHGKRDRWDEYLPQVLLGTSDSNTCGNWISPVLSSVRNSSSSPN